MSVRTIRDALFLGDECLHAMSDGNLIGLRKDASRLRGARLREAEKLQRLSDRINEVLSSREAKSEVEVSDHAVLRYLERVQGVDVQAVRDQLEDDALAVMPLLSDRVVAREGYTLCFSDRNCVTTVYSGNNAEPDVSKRHMRAIRRAGDGDEG